MLSLSSNSIMLFSERRIGRTGNTTHASYRHSLPRCPWFSGDGPLWAAKTQPAPIICPLSETIGRNRLTMTDHPSKSWPNSRNRNFDQSRQWNILETSETRVLGLVSQIGAVYMWSKKIPLAKWNASVGVIKRALKVSHMHIIIIMLPGRNRIWRTIGSGIQVEPL